MSLVSLRGIAFFVVVFLDFSCVLRFRRLFVGRIFVSIFSFPFLFFYLWSSAKYLPGGNASDRFFSVFSCLAKRLFWLCFPCSLGSGVPGLGLVFSRVCHPSHFWAWFGSFGCGVTHPIFGSGSVFWVWSPGFFLAFFPCVYSVPGFSGLF